MDRARSLKVLFFSRGRGRGHAVPDLAIAREMEQLLPDMRLRFASYSTGAATLAENGYEVIDLGLADEAPFLQSLVMAQRAIVAEQPDVVVAHEEFAALPAAKSLGYPTSFIVDFFPPEKSAWMEALTYADEILFIERRGIFPEPAHVKGKVRYLGPVVRDMVWTRADRERARHSLSLPSSALVVAVIPGAWATERRAPILDVVTAAFERLAEPEKKLVWVAGDDYEVLSQRLAGDRDVVVLRSHSPIEQLMVASDLVITKANRGTTIDLNSLGVPSISLSYGLNPIDESILPRIRSNHALDARGVDAEFLSELIRQVVRGGATTPLVNPLCPQYGPGGAAPVAAELARFIGIRPSTEAAPVEAASPASS
jgi:UDP-N-acetylglucosamine:LPS N-acetylglucosamine transferase